MSSFKAGNVLSKLVHGQRTLLEHSLVLPSAAIPARAANSAGRLLRATQQQFLRASQSLQYLCPPLLRAEDVEIMSRMMRKFDRDGNVDPVAVELGNTIIHVCVVVGGQAQLQLGHHAAWPTRTPCIRLPPAPPRMLPHISL